MRGLVTFALALALALLGTPALAGDGGDFAKELSASSCSGGPVVINVHETVVNDIDSGQAGNYWAYDDFQRTIQVRDNGDGTFCAIVRYEGEFTTVAGRGPGNTGNVAAGITGSFHGGYRATISGSLLWWPVWSTRGDVGTVDYQCTASTGTCATAVDWVTQYFGASAGFAFDWWGWRYHTAQNGDWLNAVTGNSGDIN
jgi:hypothetical protein